MAKRIWKVSINPRDFPRDGLWPILREHGLIAIGWPVDKPEWNSKKDVKDFHSITPGDVIIAYGGGYTIKGIGIAKSTPRFYKTGKLPRLLANRLHRIGEVNWIIVRDLITKDVHIPSRKVRGLSWFDTVHELTQEQWEETKKSLEIDI